MLLEHEEQHTALRGRDGVLQSLAVLRQPREDRVEVVVQVLVVDVLGLAGLQIQTLLARWRWVKRLKENSKLTFNPDQR